MKRDQLHGRGARVGRTPIVLALLLCLLSGFSALHGQDLRIPGNLYDDADDAIKERKAFLRERWFYEQRMYPFNQLPDDAFAKAMRQRDELRRAQGFRESAAMWTSLGPTSGAYFNYGNISGRTTTIQYDPVNPSTIYVGAAFGGVWKTTNGGTSWSAKTDFEASLSSGALAIDPTNPNVVYYGTGEATYSGASYYGRGLLKSTNGGETWTNYTSGLGSYTYFSRIVVRPNFPDQLLAALGSRGTPSVTGGMYRSTNGGQTWSVVLSGRADDVVFSPSGDTVYAVGSGVGFRISTNGGQTFTSSSALTMQTRNHIAVCASNPSILYAATHASSSISVFKSTDAGASFTQVAVGTDFNGGQAWYDFYVHVNPFDPDYVYVGSIDIWRSTNGGTSFQNITNGYSGGSVHVDQHNVGFHPTDPHAMFSVNDGGVWRSTNRGTSWTNLNSSFTLTQFYRITSDPSNASHILGGTQDNGTQRTTGAINWAAAFGGDGGEVCFHSQNPSFILGETQNNGIYRSTNGGVSWASSTSGLSGSGAWVAPILSHPDSAGIFYTARQSVFKSTNNGASWSSISTGISGTIREMAISKSNPQVMFATIGSSVYRSTNRGYTWGSVTSGLPSRTITTVTIHPDSSNVVLLSFSGFGAGKVYRSTNTGTTWTNISGNLPDTPVNNVLVYPVAGTYLVATDVGVFITSNYGATWTELADGLPNTVAMHLDYHEATGKLRVGTHGRGVYETVLQAALAVTSPNGGEGWPLGSSQTITWTSLGVAGNVRIDLSTNGGTSFITLFASTANDGSESWTVSGAATASARIRIVSVSDTTVADTSNSNFFIVHPTVTVTVPNGGETWTVGTSQTIQWISSNLTGNVRIELSRDNGVTYPETLFVNTGNDGTQTWTVTGPVTAHARVRIVSIAVPSAADAGNGSFSIVNPTITVTVPDGGETWAVGTSRTILWTSSNLTGTVRMELSRDNGTTYPDTLFANTPNDGTQVWTVTGPATAHARVRIVSIGVPSVADASNDTFAIVQPSISVTHPDGGEALLLDSLVIIEWSSANIGGDVMVELSRDGGSAFDTLFAGTPDDGAEEWTVTGPTTSRAMVRISSTDGPLVADVSDTLFSISAITHVAVAQGWNMLSIPVTVPDPRRSTVFPSAVSQAYGFTPAGGYNPIDSMSYGKGYWVKFPADGHLALTGGERTLDTIDVSAGWNMIGSITYDVPIDSIIQLPSGIVVSSYYGYEPQYVEKTTIVPAQAYWVKVSQGGKLVVRRMAAAVPASPGQESR